ncbi:DUF1850 domain-containing protein [Propionivibrio sp.]|uniref:DUF1850 domain-containing protein n=1 Tax=Propionivibrio sp. TaxID=2212460 RepID=UPI002635BF7D|nr:DUF1850 domain-containing protein [Propionivibrio sp.]
MALCLIAGAVSAVLAVNSFTLAWMHSIERVRWEEDWRVVDGRQLQIVAARIKGSGAGMEPPADAVLRDGAWHYRPPVAAMDSLTLAHSSYTQGYELCADGACQTLTDYLPGIAASGTIILTPCLE